MSNLLGGTPMPFDCAYPEYIQETLPKSKLGYGTNNLYPKFPPKMSDGRSLISSWNPESVVDDVFKKEHMNEFSDLAPLNPNWMYRRYMQKNGYQIMGQNYRETANDTGTAISVLDKDHISLQNNTSNRPFLFNSLMDPSQPPGYESSNLKSLYLTREQLNSRKSAPVIA